MLTVKPLNSSSDTRSPSEPRDTSGVLKLKQNSLIPERINEESESSQTGKEQPDDGDKRKGLSIN